MLIHDAKKITKKYNLLAMLLLNLMHVEFLSSSVMMIMFV